MNKERQEEIRKAIVLFEEISYVSWEYSYGSLKNIEVTSPVYHEHARGDDPCKMEYRAYVALDSENGNVFNGAYINRYSEQIIDNLIRDPEKYRRRLERFRRREKNKSLLELMGVKI